MPLEVVAMWRNANGLLLGVPGRTSHPGSGGARNQGDATTPEPSRSKSNRRAWIPALDRTPPLVQFIMSLGRWLRARFGSGVSQTVQLRLVGQLGLGAKRHLSLVEVDGVQFLVGGGVEHVTVIVPISTARTSATENFQNAGRSQSR